MGLVVSGPGDKLHLRTIASVLALLCFHCGFYSNLQFLDCFSR